VNQIFAANFLPLAQGALQAGAADPSLNLLQLHGNSTLIKGHQPQLLLADTLSPVRARTASRNLEAELQLMGPQTFNIDSQLQRRYSAGSFWVGAALLNTSGTIAFALHRVEYRQTYASLSTKTLPSPFRCIGWSIGQSYAPLPTKTFDHDIGIYMTTSRPVFHLRPGKLTRPVLAPLTCKFIA
jgi:hypothetical protein